MRQIAISGATRLNLIIGDPIVQVKSPAGLSRAFAAASREAIVAPAQIGSAQLDAFMEALTAMGNLDGIVVTLPHKFACLAHCSTMSDRARHLQAVNVMRRNPDRRWHGDMLDGLGFVEAAIRKGFDFAGRRGILVGAGGAGSAIGLALLEAGLSSLSVHDSDTGKRDVLIAKLGSLSPHVGAGSDDATGYDVIVNASPAGMKGFEATAVDIATVASHAFVGCVVTEPEVTPLIDHARKLGCTTVTGSDMYEALEGRMLRFLIGEEP
ncbi:shikimate dehydrogenase family protein [Bosea sp. PAMC 26642]|uniref:shikimate dehydrogenase family protein n=1 Tax=Bosea sp. (strain PAMC 26642) TaxID=1792307 RepID=UPI00076FE1C5|nr:shikimate dehydrogenase [Bosea sp. PAMC 26642]AMJ61446.1 shikimate dehydrogenase [Bosea sp. PAMC 26642]